MWGVGTMLWAPPDLKLGARPPAPPNRVLVYLQHGFELLVEPAVERFAAQTRDGGDALGLEAVEDGGGPAEVPQDGAAHAAGLEVGDVLLEVNGRPITSPLDWDVGLLDAGVGSSVDIQYRRGEDLLTARLSVEELPSEQAVRLEVVRGLELISVTPPIAVERRLEIETGALIVQLAPGASRVSSVVVMAPMPLAATSAASFTRLARSAPENPGVPRAMIFGWTSSPIGTLRICTFKICSRPRISGKPTNT